MEYTAETEKKKEISRDVFKSKQTYQGRIDFLMSGGKNSVGTLYIDVTANRIISAIWGGDDWDGDENVKNWLITNIYPFVEGENGLEALKRDFSRDNLTRLFQRGQTELRLKHRFRKNHRIFCYRIDVNMFQNPENGHIEACASWKDYTLKYVDSEIQKVLYQTDYQALGLIEVEKGMIYIRSNRFKEMELEEEAVFSYADCVKQMETMRIYEKDRERFARCTSLEYLADNMAIAGCFSFLAHNVEHELERYTYHWFDEEHRILIFVIENMTKESETDALTGSLNRMGFFRKTEEILLHNPKEEFAILYFNIQRFKAFNDLLGYEAGDSILCNMMNDLQMSFLKPLAIARMEADHITALVDVRNLDLTKLSEVLHVVYTRNQMKMDIYGRCGIFYIPKDSKLSISDMCDFARLAKSHIPNQYVRPYAIFNEQMKREYEQKSIAMISLDYAMKNDEFSVYYQPVYDAWTGEIIAAEALVRWISKENGVILPGNFIAALEESGHITRLDSFVNQKVFQFQKERYEAGKPVVPLTVNLSRMDLMDENIMNEIKNCIGSSEIPKNLLRYEITESAYTTIDAAGNQFLSDLRQAGVRVLLDDFGSGVSSFSTIQDFEFDVMKLDMGFIQKIGYNKKNNNILISVIELAHRLDMKVVAEGVETKEQLDFLRDYGCDYIQGYYFSKPLPQKEFVELLEKQ